MYKMADTVGTQKTQHKMNYQEAQLLQSTAHQAGLQAAPVDHYVAVKEDSLYPTPLKGSAVTPPSPKQVRANQHDHF